MKHLENLNIQQKLFTLNWLWNRKYTEDEKEIRKQKVKEIKQWFKDHTMHIRNIKLLSSEVHRYGEKEIWRLFDNWEEEVPEYKDSWHYRWYRKNYEHKNEEQTRGIRFSNFREYILYSRWEDIKPYQWFRIQEYKENCDLKKNGRTIYNYELLEEYRHRHIAWSLLKGTPYDKIEQPHENNKPNWKEVEKYVNEYFKELSITEETLCVSA